MTAAEREVRRLRQQSHLLAGTKSATAGAVVRHMLAMQGQDLPGLLWSLGVRAAPDVAESDVRAAFDAGHIVRAWPMRGTLHAIAGEDLAWVLALTGERMIASAAGRRRQLGLTDDDVRTAVSGIERELERALRLRRSDVVSVIAATGIDPGGQRAAHIISVAAQRGSICLGPFDGTEQLFVSYPDWVAVRPVLERDEALAELARRYLAGHGPASVQDLAWWAGVTLTDARRAVEALDEAVSAFTIDGITLYAIDTSAPGHTTTAKARAALLLPGFDETVLGYRDRALTIPPEHASRIVPGGNGMFMPTIQRDGTAIGLWKRTDRARHTDIALLPFGDLSGSARTEIDRAAAHYGRFRGMRARVLDGQAT